MSEEKKKGKVHDLEIQSVVFIHESLTKPATKPKKDKEKKNG